ncbi:MAG: glucose-6-phosphate isomerase [Sulfuritalea sp.]|jgi:glucose-6-phosphate isomerase|nr:glucose-6-phosphate isomerase [Sulfuritalea sp.]
MKATWEALKRAADTGRNVHLRDMFAADGQRFARLSVSWNDWLLDYSKQRVTPETMDLLRGLWQTADVPGWIARMRDGSAINHSEGRAALHIVLRHPAGKGPILHAGHDVMPAVLGELDKMRRFAAQIHGRHWRGATGEPITDIVNIGIGGSDLGPRMATQALAAFRHPELKVHYVANLDGADLATVIKGLQPRTTLFIIASKTFTTQETMQNAASARHWLVQALGEAAVSRHFVAVSTNLTEVARFGIDPENAFAFWDWVGGRYSLWSAIGLPLVLAVGFDHFQQLLAGAHAMDEHFFSAPPAENLPGLLALLEIWNSNFLGAENRALLPYSQSLALLPRYLQQLEMESNGKQVDRQGAPLDCATAPILWGEAGTNGQHAFYQLIHQGGRLVPCEFIVCRQPDFALPGHHEKLLANCFAQSEALMRGRTLAETTAELVASGMSADQVALLAPYRSFPGNQPSTTLLLPRLDPFTLGALLALYEHKVFVESIIWNINPFDQWGVEYGKQLAGRLLPIIEGKAPTDRLDSSTAGLINASMS